MAKINMPFFAMTNHSRALLSSSGLGQGQVEKDVRTSRDQMLQGMRDFQDFPAERPAGRARPRGLAPDPAWVRLHRRCLPRGTGPADAAAPCVRWLYPVERAGLTHMPDQRRVQSLQASGVICEPPFRPADLSRTSGGGRGQHPVSTCPCDPTQSQAATTDDLRLTALSGSRARANILLHNCRLFQASDPSQDAF